MANRFTDDYQRKIRRYIDNFKENFSGKDDDFIIPRGGWGMAGTKNHCKYDCMSRCGATDLQKKSEKFESQKECKFFQEATNSKRCLFETFSEYCWCIEAQKDSKK